MSDAEDPLADCELIADVGDATGRRRAVVPADALHVGASSDGPDLVVGGRDATVRLDLTAAAAERIATALRDAADDDHGATLDVREGRVVVPDGGPEDA